MAEAKLVLHSSVLYVQEDQIVNVELSSPFRDLAFNNLVCFEADLGVVHK